MVFVEVMPSCTFNGDVTIQIWAGSSELCIIFGRGVVSYADDLRGEQRGRTLLSSIHVSTYKYLKFAVSMITTCSLISD